MDRLFEDIVLSSSEEIDISKENKYISDVIGDEYKKWNGSTGSPIGNFTEGDYVYIDSGTGTGKTFFIFNILSKYAKENGEKILYLCNRVTLKDDAEKLKKYFKANNVDIKTYQSVERILADSKKRFDEGGNRTLKYRTRYLALYSYKYIVADEMHYLLEDSSFNRNTHYVHWFLKMASKPVKILISATGDYAIDFYREKIKHTYSCVADKSYIKLHFYRDNPKKGFDFPVEKINEIIENNDTDKVIYFVDKKERIDTICKEHIDIGSVAHCMFSESQNDEKKLNDLECIKHINDEEITFPKRVLLTTSVISNGVTLKDRRIKHIICDIKDIFTAIQCIGRKRAIDNDDICHVYIKYYYYKELENELTKAYKKFEICRKLLSTEEKEYAFLEYNDQLGKEYSDCYYIDWLNGGKVKCNTARMERLYQDIQVYQKMREYNDNSKKDWSAPYIDCFKYYSGLNNVMEIIKDKSIEQALDELVQVLEKYRGEWILAKSEEANEIKAAFWKTGVKMKEFSKAAEQVGYSFINKERTKKKIRYYYIEKLSDKEQKAFKPLEQIQVDQDTTRNSNAVVLECENKGEEIISSTELDFGVKREKIKNTEGLAEGELSRLPFGGYYKNIFR